MIRIECPTCGSTRKVRRDRVTNLTCPQCRKSIPEPTERDALTGGSWQPDPSRGILVWVPDEQEVA